MSFQPLLTDKEVDGFADFEPHPLADTSGPAHLLFMALKRACIEIRGRRAPQAESAWLLEQQVNGQAWWWTGTRVNGCMIWTPNANQAVRFSRKEDAERTRDVLRKYGVAGMHEAFATDHMWCPPLSEVES